MTLKTPPTLRVQEEGCQDDDGRVFRGPGEKGPPESWVSLPGFLGAAAAAAK